MTNIIDIIDIIEYFVDNHADIEEFEFSKPGEQSLRQSRQYVMLHLHQPVLQQIVQQQQNPADRFTINVAFHEKMSYSTNLEARKTSINKLHSIANQFVAYIRRFEKIKVQRNISEGPDFLDVVGDATIVTESYERDDVTNMCTVSITIDCRYVTDYCDINWVE